ncbi:hypothetical protein LA080_006469 [Diaporthe eres]|nr:hypothetical protein LA080_006469 [Diaporthe eres]
MITAHFLSLVVAIAHLAQPSTAQWQAGKGAQVNFYRDTSCSQFQSSATAWWDRFSRVSDYAPYSDEPECLSHHVGAAQSRGWAVCLRSTDFPHVLQSNPKGKRPSFIHIPATYLYPCSRYPEALATPESAINLSLLWLIVRHDMAVGTGR